MKAEANTSPRVLIVDDDGLFREVMARRLTQAGQATVVAPSYEEGLRLLERFSSIGVVILDHAPTKDGMTRVVELIRAVRPTIQVVGNSGSDRRAEFAAAGVTSYLQKPWRVEDLLELLRRPIGNCGECGLPLPLRQPYPNEAGQSWCCAFCGARYHAVADEKADPDIRGNALPVDQPPV